MPIKEFECQACKHRFEEILGLNEPVPEKCPKCGNGPLKQLLGTFRIAGASKKSSRDDDVAGDEFGGNEEAPPGEDYGAEGDIGGGEDFGAEDSLGPDGGAGLPGDAGNGMDAGSGGEPAGGDDTGDAGTARDEEA